MENNDTSPVTANKLRNMRVVPNFSLLRLINLRMPTERHSHNPELFLYLPVEMLGMIFFWGGGAVIGINLSSCFGPFLVLWCR